MWVGVLELTVTFYATSLKDKRSVVKRILGRTRTEFGLAAAEVDHQDELESAVLGFSVVGSDAKVLAAVLARVDRFVEQLEIAEIVASRQDVMQAF